MKITLDDKQVPSRCWYYLLDWNQQDEWATIKELEPDAGGRLHLLTHEQFWALWKIAVEQEQK